MAKARRIDDLTPSRVQGALKAVRDGDAEHRGVSLRSLHHYTRAVKGFSRWLWRDGRSREDTLAHLTSPNPDADRRHARRPLSPEEQAKLIQAAATGPVVLRMAGCDRAALYRVALGTGFRANELRSLTHESFRLEDDPPTIAVAAAYSKHRRDDVQPIRTDLADLLKPWLASRPAGKPVFGRLTKHTNLLIQSDLARAGLPYRDASGKVADFHALRHSYVTALAKTSAPVKTVQTLARHSTPTLTLGVYTHIGMADQSAALNALPSPALRPEGATPSESESDAPINKPFAHHLPTGGDGTGRDLADAVANADVKSEVFEPTSMSSNSQEALQLDISGRDLADAGGAEGVGFEPTVGLHLLRFSRPSQSATLAPLPRNEESYVRLLSHFVDDVLGHEDRDVDGHGNSDGITWTRVDLDKFAAVTDSKLSEVGVVTKLADIDVLKFAVEQFDSVGEKVVCQGARRREAFDAAIDAGCFEDTDHDRERSLAVHFLEEDDLLLIVLVDDDPRKFHLHGHGGGPPGRRHHGAVAGICPATWLRIRLQGANSLTD